MYARPSPCFLPLIPFSAASACRAPLFSLLPPHLQEIHHGTIIGLFKLNGEITGRQLIHFPVIVQTFATLVFFAAWLIGAGAMRSVLLHGAFHSGFSFLFVGRRISNTASISRCRLTPGMLNGILRQHHNPFYKEDMPCPADTFSAWTALNASKKRP